jgi:hypothetical protein
MLDAKADGSVKAVPVEGFEKFRGYYHLSRFGKDT